MSLTERKKCAGTCYANLGWVRWCSCTRWASVGDYCRTHDPATIKAKSEVRDLKRKKKFGESTQISQIKQENELVGAWIRANWSRLSTTHAFVTYLTLAKEDRVNKP